MSSGIVRVLSCKKENGRELFMGRGSVQKGSHRRVVLYCIVVPPPAKEFLRVRFLSACVFVCVVGCALSECVRFCVLWDMVLVPEKIILA